MRVQQNQHDIEEIKIIISGNVQGVGFRATVKNYAEKLGIKGTARNDFDGTVEIYAQGNPEQLNAFLRMIKEKPGLGRVQSADVIKRNLENYFVDFKIVY